MLMVERLNFPAFDLGQCASAGTTSQEAFGVLFSKMRGNLESQSPDPKLFQLGEIVGLIESSPQVFNEVFKSVESYTMGEISKDELLNLILNSAPKKEDGNFPYDLLAVHNGEDYLPDGLTKEDLADSIIFLFTLYRMPGKNLPYGVEYGENQKTGGFLNTKEDDVLKEDLGKVYKTVSFVLGLNMGNTSENRGFSTDSGVSTFESGLAIENEATKVSRGRVFTVGLSPGRASGDRNFEPKTPITREGTSNSVFDADILENAHSTNIPNMSGVPVGNNENHTNEEIDFSGVRVENTNTLTPQEISKEVFDTIFTVSPQKPEPNSGSSAFEIGIKQGGQINNPNFTIYSQNIKHKLPKLQIQNTPRVFPAHANAKTEIKIDLIKTFEHTSYDVLKIRETKAEHFKVLNALKPGQSTTPVSDNVSDIREYKIPNSKSAVIGREGLIEGEISKTSLFILDNSVTNDPKVKSRQEKIFIKENGEVLQNDSIPPVGKGGEKLTSGTQKPGVSKNQPEIFAHDKKADSLKEGKDKTSLFENEIPIQESKNVISTKNEIAFKDEKVPVSNQAFEAFLEMAREGRREIVVKLNPENLGQLSIRVSQTKDGISAKIIAESLEAMKELTAQSDVLKGLLKDAGVKLDNLEIYQNEKETGFSQNSSNHQRGQEKWQQEKWQESTYHFYQGGADEKKAEARSLIKKIGFNYFI